ncbi:MAG TPA: hypothetical protein VFM80_12050 [Gracilimonas sp.]|uniref:hypothetical protein n=1 Tax=Gracilimonas sp. TaxID=1974203 RepID=UPI002D8AA07C|nr:hypothetical protein [Gracilimonas sp.]
MFELPAKSWFEILRGITPKLTFNNFALRMTTLGVEFSFLSFPTGRWGMSHIGSASRCTHRCY